VYTGNVHSLSSQTVLGGIVLLSGVAYYLYPQTPPTHAAKPSNSTPPKLKKKGKKKNSKQSTFVQADPSSKDQGAVAPIVVAFPTILPGQFDAVSITSDEAPASQSKKSRKKGKGKYKQTTAGASSAVVHASPTVKAQTKAFTRTFDIEIHGR
jgi:hypothetical protein